MFLGGRANVAPIAFCLASCPHIRLTSRPGIGRRSTDLAGADRHEANGLCHTLPRRTIERFGMAAGPGAVATADRGHAVVLHFGEALRLQPAQKFSWKIGAIFSQAVEAAGILKGQLSSERLETHRTFLDFPFE